MLGVVLLVRPRTVPASLRVNDTAAALSTAATLGAVKVDTAAYRQAALEARNATGELLPGVVVVPPSEHFGISFGKDSGSHGGKEDEAASE